MNKKHLLLLFLLIFSFSLIQAQTTQDVPLTSTQFDMTGFPQWTRDLRRAEIIAFGSFPFTYFFTSFGVDIYRSATHEWDRRYAPWPFEGAGSIGKTHQQKLRTIGIAAGCSILIALIDYGIVQHKRRVKARQSLEYPEGTPIIVRSGENAGDNAGDNAGENPGDNIGDNIGDYAGDNILEYAGEAAEIPEEGP
ncbi:MAG: hypothetical protein FWH35_04550 [Treponema sp.]|nr:hypothetical protein [Treponema sp.]